MYPSLSTNNCPSESTNSCASEAKKGKFGSDLSNLNKAVAVLRGSSSHKEGEFDAFARSIAIQM
jgi:outer membrane murein-binding lipoprotein Lpp